MDIKQLSSIIDKKLVQLEKQLHDLQQKQLSNQIVPQLDNDILALEQLKHKLIKSRELAWRAHDLRRSSDKQLLQQKRWIGLGILAFSIIGLIMLIIVAFIL